MEKAKLSTKQIEKMAIDYAMDFLKKENPERRKHGPDIICNGKYIDVKGCLKKETNIRMTKQALDSIEKEGGLKQGSFFIYYVYAMENKPKLKIFDYNTFEKYKIPETRWLIQHNKIKEEIRSIPLEKLKFDW
jgi:hypothetical protein